MITLVAWIFKGQWMWHVQTTRRVLCWGRLTDFAEEYMFFTYCTIGEQE